MQLTFSELQNQIIDLDNKIQELSSSVYCVYRCEEYPAYTFICYYDLQADTMNTALLQDGIAIRLFEGVPLEVMAAYGTFCSNVLAYQNGDADTLPYISIQGQDQDQEPTEDTAESVIDPSIKEARCKHLIE